MVWPTPQAQSDLLHIANLANAAGRVDVAMHAFTCSMHPDVHPPEYSTLMEHEAWVLAARNCVDLGDFDGAIPMLEHLGSRYAIPMGAPLTEDDLQEVVKVQRRALEAQVADLQGSIRRLDAWLEAHRHERKKRKKKDKGG